MRKLTRTPLIIILIAGFLIRIWDIGSVPPGLYWDEMDVGYQAYSILKTGRDYFGNSPVLVIQSFADFRAPLLIYLTIPFVAFFGLSSISVRLPAVLFGVISVFLIYLLSKILFKSEKISLTAAVLTAFTPWSIQFSRMAFEVNLLLTLFLAGLICFFKGLSNSKYWTYSGVLFGLSVFAYNTAKLLTPLIIIALVLIFIRRKNINKSLLLGGIIVLGFVMISLHTTFFQGGGQRFSEIAVWTDPQLISNIDRLRQESNISYTDERGTGMSPRNLDKLFYNKITFIFDKISRNYLKAISTDFLFISGDPNLRHSPQGIGEFFRIEFITVVFGLLWLMIVRKKSSIFILAWIVLAPIPAVVTREGGTHATRLFLLFPVLTIISSAGLFYIIELTSKKINKLVVGGIALVWVFSVIFYLNYYFGSYKLESAKFFQYGFSEAVEKAISNHNTYKYVIIDDRNDSALMNFLFVSKFDPSNFQSNIKNLSFEFGSNNFGKFNGDRLENFYFMKPGRRDWYLAFEKNLINDDYLLIVSSAQLEEQTPQKLQGRLTRNQKLLEVIYYKTGEPAFYIIENKKPEVKL